MKYNLKNQKLLIASNNQGKVREIQSLLSSFDFEVISASSFDIPEPEETGLTFAENSRLKAKYYGSLTNLPALADDSGFCVEELDGFPGLYSARVAGEDKNYYKVFNQIEDSLKQRNLETSKAHFICSLAIWYPDGSLYDFEGRVDGMLSFPAKGENGFGYDPIFVPQGYNKTFAQMNKVEKDQISHRFIAFKKLVDNLLV